MTNRKAQLDKAFANAQKNSLALCPRTANAFQIEQPGILSRRRIAVMPLILRMLSGRLVASPAPPRDEGDRCTCSPRVHDLTKPARVALVQGNGIVTGKAQHACAQVQSARVPWILQGLAMTHACGHQEETSMIKACVCILEAYLEAHTIDVRFAGRVHSETLDVRRQPFFFQRRLVFARRQQVLFSAGKVGVPSLIPTPNIVTTGSKYKCTGWITCCSYRRVPLSHSGMKLFECQKDAMGSTRMRKFLTALSPPPIEIDAGACSMTTERGRTERLSWI